MIVTLNFQMSHLGYNARPISMGAACRTDNGSPISIFYAEFTDFNIGGHVMSLDQYDWICKNVKSKLLLSQLSHTVSESYNKYTSDNVSTLINFNHTKHLAHRFVDWLSYIRRRSGMGDDELFEIVSDIPAYVMVMLSRVLDCSAIDMEHKYGIAPYHICLNETITQTLGVSRKEAFDMDRFQLLSPANKMTYMSIGHNTSGRVTYQSLFNCLETYLVYHQLIGEEVTFKGDEQCNEEQWRAVELGKEYLLEIKVTDSDKAFDFITKNLACKHNGYDVGFTVEKFINKKDAFLGSGRRDIVNQINRELTGLSDKIINIICN